MATFSFRLQTVLDYRRSTVGQLRLELAALEARQEEEVEKMNKLCAAERTLLRELGERQRSGRRISEIVQLTEQLDTLRLRTIEQAAVLRRLRAEANELRRHVVDANKGVKVLENLRERQAEVFRQEVQRLEQMDTDEIATNMNRRARARS